MQELSCSLNFDSHTGRGKLSLANPRYSGLRGDTLSGGFRWERDVVRLEKLVLQQQRSRYGLVAREAKGFFSEHLCVSFNNFMKTPLFFFSHTPGLTCRYEVQGEYNIPPNTPLPSSAADLALPAAGPAGNYSSNNNSGSMVGAAAAPMGRWRVQVMVPSAELQEIVPAARLLQSATSLSPVEYERAKAVFLQASMAGVCAF